MKYACSMFMILGLFNTVKPVTVEEVISQLDNSILSLKGINVTRILDTYDWLISHYGFRSMFTKEEIAEFIQHLTRKCYYEINIQMHYYLYSASQDCVLQDCPPEDINDLNKCLLDSMVRLCCADDADTKFLSGNEKKVYQMKSLIALLASFRAMQNILRQILS